MLFWVAKCMLKDRVAGPQGGEKGPKGRNLWRTDFGEFHTAGEILSGLTTVRIGPGDAPGGGKGVKEAGAGWGACDGAGLGRKKGATSGIGTKGAGNPNEEPPGVLIGMAGAAKVAGTLRSGNRWKKAAAMEKDWDRGAITPTEQQI